MLKMLRKIIQEVSSAQDIGVALNLVVQQTRLATDADACSIFLTSEDSGEYVLVATDGLNKKLINKLRIKFGVSLISLVGERAEPINIADTFEHPKFCHYTETKQPYRAFLGVPIIHQGELLGVLAAQKIIPSSFTEVEEAFLVTLSAQLAGNLAFAKISGMAPKLIRKKQLVVNGNPSSSGVAIGKLVIVYAPSDLEALPDRKCKEEDIEQQIRSFKKALKDTHTEINKLKNSLASQLLEEGTLFDGYLQILESRNLKKEVINEIRAGNWAQGALKKVIKQRVTQFETMEDKYLQERAQDIMELGQRILINLQEAEHKTLVYPKQTILLGEKITPTAIAEVPEGRLVGIISLQGSANSHAAILARALGIPAIMGCDCPLNLDNKLAIIDGYYGQVYIAPSKELRQEFAILSEQEQELNTELNEVRGLATQTSDKHPISLLVNTGLPIDIDLSLRTDADGIGLYRTEIPFMTRDCFLSEEEQYVLYRQLLKAFAPKPVVMRTLDVGGDKSLPYFPIQETNPFLGWRGIRLTLDHPEIFLVQIRAMLRANVELGNLKILLPMISNINEIEQATLLVNQAYLELKEEMVDVQMPQLGVMIETPSAVYQAQDFAKRVDFLSVGSNDLTQYLLAVDRTNARVLHLYDHLHPAVLKALSQVVVAAHLEHKQVSICGEMAGDPSCVLLLIAMGFDALSVNANQVLRVKWLIRKSSMREAQKLLTEVMAMDEAMEVRYHIEQALENLGVAGLIRAGR